MNKYIFFEPEKHHFQYDLINCEDNDVHYGQILHKND